jgi:hypothetical protein
MIAAFIEAKFPKPLSLYSRAGVDFDPWVLGQDYKEPLEAKLATLGPPNGA